jgi:hypothetical protein
MGQIVIIYRDIKSLYICIGYGGQCYKPAIYFGWQFDNLTHVYPELTAGIPTQKGKSRQQNTNDNLIYTQSNDNLTHKLRARRASD